MLQAPIALTRQNTFSALLVQAHRLLPDDPARAEALLEAALEMMPRNGPSRIAAPPSGSRLKRLTRFIDEHIAEPLSLNRLADLVGLSRSQLTRNFKARFGVSLQTYIRGRRVILVQSRMRQDRSSLAQLALDCGFSDQSHLSRVFRHTVGTSPGRWRLDQEPRGRQGD